jgi:raffinose/stachyose/melibiose transport system substrate-binding protein
MASTRRARAVLAVLATTTLVATACSGSSETPSEDDIPYDSPVTLTWWHNATEGVGNAFWQKVANDFMAAHPTVTIEIEAIETNQLQRTRIPAALLTDDPPDLFMVWGGGEIREQVLEGDYLKDLTDYLPDDRKRGAAAIWQVNGRQYGLPWTLGIEGIWYNKQLFADAGITKVPTTLDELNDAVEKLKAINVIPIAVGAGDKWPAAHWWYNFALRACSVETLQRSAVEFDFSDPCFVQAGKDLQEFVATNPFQPDFINTVAQQGAGSSAGLVANRQAAMELMGHWNFGVIAGLAGAAAPPDRPEDSELWQQLEGEIGWFKFPATGGAGDPTASLGGGDGFGCAKNAPIECVEFLKYITSPEVQTAYAAEGLGIPVASGAEAGLEDEVLKDVAKATSEANYIQLWLDTAYGSTVGNAMNDAIIAIFAGTGTPEQVVEAMERAARQ